MLKLLSTEIRTTVTLRALVGVGLGALILAAAPGWRFGLNELLLLFFLLSNAPLLRWRRLREHWSHARAVLLLADTALVAVLVMRGAPGLALVFFMVVLLVALGDRWGVQLAAAAALAGLHAWLAFDSMPSIQPAMLLPVPMFFSIALYYGFHTGCVRGEAEGHDRARIENDELRVLVEVIRGLTRTLEPREIMATVVAHCNEILPAKRMSVIMSTPESDTAMVLATSDDVQSEPLQIRLDDYPELQECLRSGEPLLVEDATRHPLTQRVREQLRAVGCHSLLLVPLTYRDAHFGSLVLHASSPEQRLAPEQVRFFNTVAAITANALNNALLHQELRTTADDLADVFDHTPDLMVTTDRQGKVLRANKAADRVLHAQPGSLVGRRLAAWYPAFDTAGVRNAMADGSPWCDEMAALYGDNGRAVDADLTIAPMAGRDGLLVVARDVTEIRSSRRALLQTDRLRGIGELASAVAHEMNNALTGVMGNAQLLQSVPEVPHKADRPLQRIADNAERCARIVRNLLRFGRERGQGERLVSLNALIDNVVELYGYRLKSRRIELERDFESDLPPTAAAPERIEQVFLILIQNAVQALSSRDEAGTIRLRTYRDGDYLTAEIRDDGPGIPPELQERVFEPFFTTQPDERNGLGLAVAAGVVEQLGGRVECARVDVGALFRVCVPIREPAVQTQDAAREAVIRDLDTSVDLGRSVASADDEDASDGRRN